MKKVGLFTVDEKIAALDMEIAEIRGSARHNPASPLHHQYEVLKALAADLRARQQLPRNNALGALEREVVRIRAARSVNGVHQPEIATEIANIVVSKWPVISQALELFGEESAE